MSPSTEHFASFDGTRLAIHQVGAAVQEVPSCNGWLFWHVENKVGGLRVLDELRAEVAAG